MTRNKKIRIEDLELDLPVSESKIKGFSRNRPRRGSSPATRDESQARYKIIQTNDTNSQRFHELLQNPAFGITKFKMDNDIRAIVITSANKSFAYGASNISLSFIDNYKKYSYLFNKTEDYLHNKFKYLIEEDFDTDVDWGVSGPIGTPLDSSGYNKQELVIPWMEEVGTWATSNAFKTVGTQSLEHTTNDGALNIISAGYEWWVNYEIKTDILFDDLGNSDAAGIVFRYIDTDNYYRFYFYHNTGSQLIRLVKKKAGVSTTLIDRSFNFTIEVDKWYELRVIAQGNKIKCYIGNQLIVDHIDTNFIPTGKVGLYANYNNIHFDRFKCTLAPPLTVNLPADVDYINQEHLTISDTLFGQQKLLIEPRPIEFTLNNDPNCVLDLQFNQEEGELISDRSRHNNNAKLFNGTWIEDIEKGNCLEFDGINDYFEIDDHISLDSNISTSGELVVDMEIYFASGTLTDSQWHGILMKDSCYHIQKTNTNKLNFFVYQTGTDSNLEWDYNDNLEEETWYRLTFVWIQNGNHLIFINGKLVEWIMSQSGTLSTSSTNIYNYYAGGNDRLFKGRIKYIKMYEAIRWDIAYGINDTLSTVFVYDDCRNRSESAENHATIFKSFFIAETTNYIYDASGKSNDFLLYNNPTFVDMKGTRFMTALDFDHGANEYARRSDDTDFTFFGGIKDTAATFEIVFTCDQTTGDDQTIITKVSEWKIYISDDNFLRVEFYDNSASAQIGKGIDKEITYGIRYHLIVTYDGSATSDGVQMYLNGCLVGQSPQTSGTYVAMENLATSIYIACLSSTFENFDGKIEYLLISKTFTTAKEAEIRYNSSPHYLDLVNYQRVYSKIHNFKGYPFITNGQIMIKFPEYDIYEYRGAPIHSPTLFAYYENQWHHLGFIGPMWEDGNLRLMSYCNKSQISIEELTDQKVIINIRYWLMARSLDQTVDGSFIDLKLTVENGFPGIKWEIDSNSNMWLNSDRAGINFFKCYTWGQGTFPRFVYEPGDNLYDIDIIGASQSITSTYDNFILLFDTPEHGESSWRNVIIGLTSNNEKLRASYTYYLAGGVHPSWTISYIHNSKSGNIFFKPYEVSKLHIDGYDLTGDGSQDTEVDETDDGCFKMDANEYGEWDLGTLPEGTYVAYYRVKNETLSGGAAAQSVTDETPTSVTTHADWTNETNIYTDNAADAVVSVNDGISGSIYAYNFGFSIPAYASITTVKFYYNDVTRNNGGTVDFSSGYGATAYNWQVGNTIVGWSAQVDVTADTAWTPTKVNGISIHLKTLIFGGIGGYDIDAVKYNIIYNDSWSETNGQIYVKDDAVKTYTETVASSTSWVWRSIIFYADGASNIKLGCQHANNTHDLTDFWCDEIVCMPLANGKDYPVDLRDRGLSNKLIKRGLKK